MYYCVTIIMAKNCFTAAAKHKAFLRKEKFMHTLTRKCHEEFEMKESKKMQLLGVGTLFSGVDAFEQALLQTVPKKGKVK